MLVLCYVPVLSVVPLLADRHREVRWHAKNGLLLFAALILFGVAATVLGVFVPALNCLYITVMLVVGSLYVVVVILAVVKALQRERLIVPGISRYADRF